MSVSITPSINVPIMFRFHLRPPWNIKALFAIAIIFHLLAPASSSLWCQDIALAPAFGYESGALLSLRRDPGVINHFGVEGFGSSHSNTVWLGILGNVKQLFGLRVDGAARLSLAFSSGSFVSKPYSTFSAIDPISKQAVESTNEFEVSSVQGQLQCDLLALYSPAGNLKFLAGPWLRYRIFSSTSATERVVEPAEVIFPDSESPERSVGSGKGIESFPLHCGLLGGIGYELDLSEHVSLLPAVAVRCDADALINGLGARSLSYESSMSVRLDFSSHGSAPEPAKPVPIDTLAILNTRSHIEVSVDLFNLDTLSGSKDTATIKAQRTIYRQYTTLPPVIYFNAGADSLPARYEQFASYEEAVEGMRKARVDPVSAYHNLLNIIGKRLQESGTCTVALQFVLAPGESGELGRKRAERIRDYFNKTWNIRSSRISIAPKELKSCVGPFAHPSAVTIVVSELGTMSPAVMQWMVDDHTLPNIGLRRKITSTLGVKDWSLTIRQHGHDVTRISKEDFSDGELDAVLPLPPLNVDSVPKPLIAELTITDYAGAQGTAQDRLDIDVIRRGNEPTREIRSYYFFQPGEECPSFTSSNKALIDKIASTTRSGARITVSTGVTVSGTAWGPSRVAEDILNVLNSRSIHPSQLHLQRTARALPDTDQPQPEDEFFSHSVCVTVEQAVSGDD